MGGWRVRNKNIFVVKDGGRIIVNILFLISFRGVNGPLRFYKF